MTLFPLTFKIHCPGWSPTAAASEPEKESGESCSDSTAIVNYGEDPENRVKRGAGGQQGALTWSYYYLT